MKKMVFMAAFVAATAAFVACSSNDDLVQQKPEVPEEPTEVYPMTIRVADLATRGTDLTDADEFNFKMYGTMRDEWNGGKVFTKTTTGACQNTGGANLTYPVQNKDYYFFAISDPDNIADITGAIQDEKEVGDGYPDITVTETACSFNYAMPLLNSKSPRTDLDEYYYDSEKLQDLLVAQTIGNSGVDGGAMTVELKHALAQITEIQVYVNQQRLVKKGFTEAASNTFLFRIGGARIGGIKAVGTYTFGQDDPWSVVDGSEQQFEIPLKAESFADAAFMAKGSAKKVLHPTDGGFYIIPQAANGSVTNNPKEGIVAGLYYGIAGPYIEFDIQVFDSNVVPEHPYDEQGDGNYRVGYNLNDFENNFKWDEEASAIIKYGQVRCPLKFQKLEGGKGYALVIDLGLGVIYTNGENAAESANVSESLFNNIDITAG